MKNREKTRKLVMIAILATVLIVLAELQNFIPNVVPVNLGLIPIVVGACIYGPIVGLGLGLLDGVLIILAPATLASFFQFNPFMTIVVCLLKTGAAGYLAGVMYLVLRKVNKNVACIVASLITPVINTGIFLCFALIFFQDLYLTWMTDSTQSVIKYIIAGTLTTNFLLEFVINLVLSPTIARIISMQTASKNIKIGSVDETISNN